MIIYISRDDSIALSHHGVKGMKWGVRKDKVRTSFKRLKTSNKYKTVRAIGKYGGSVAISKAATTGTRAATMLGVGTGVSALGDVAVAGLFSMGALGVASTAATIAAGATYAVPIVASIFATRVVSKKVNSATHLAEHQQEIVKLTGEYTSKMHADRENYLKSTKNIDDSQREQILEIVNAAKENDLHHSDNLYLMHYGVLGMHWGIRKDGKPQGYKGNGQRRKLVSDNLKKRTSDFYHKHEKTIKTGAKAVAGAALASAAIYGAYKGAELDKFVNGDFQIIDGDVFGTLKTRAENVGIVLAHPDIFKRQSIVDLLTGSDQASVNPLYKQGVDAFYDKSNSTLSKNVTNCATCSSVYDLRKRGFDVSANASENLSMTDYVMSDYYKGAELSKDGYDISTLNSKLMEMPTNARGTLCGLTQHGGGHSIAWERTRDGVVYRDCQTNMTYTKDNLVAVYMDRPKGTTGNLRNVDASQHMSRSQRYEKLAGIQYARLDNALPKLRTFYDRGNVRAARPQNASQFDKAMNAIRDIGGQSDTYTSLNLNKDYVKMLRKIGQGAENTEHIRNAIIAQLYKPIAKSQAIKELMKEW